tara:strand:+ start:2914 stop:3135 length:222 start_codon:yes stop_codon:yes gene_type:complete
MKWYYNVSTNTIWTSIDYGEVEADTYDEAIDKAKEKITNDLDNINAALKHCDNTKNMDVGIDLSQLIVKPVNE